LAVVHRHLAAVKAYLGEILPDKPVIDRSINKILRFRVGGARGRESIQALEENLRELSQHYTRLVRNAWIIDGALGDARSEVETLEREVERVPRLPNPSGQEDALTRMPPVLRTELARLDHEARLVHESLETARTALTTHGMNVEILRGGELIDLQKSMEDLQKEAVSLQSAAVLVELVVVFAYTLHSWELLAHSSFGLIPSALRFFATLSFAVLLALSAHEFAHWIRRRHLSRRAYGLFAGTLLMLVSMVGLSYAFDRNRPSGNPHLPQADVLTHPTAAERSAPEREGTTSKSKESQRQEEER
jgi:hypothetical protein